MHWKQLFFIASMLPFGQALTCRSTTQNKDYNLQKLEVKNKHCLPGVLNCVTVAMTVDRYNVTFPMCEGERIVGPFGMIFGVCKMNETDCYEIGKGVSRKRICCCSHDLCNIDDFDLRSGTDTQSLILTCIGCVIAGICLNLILRFCCYNEE